MQMRAEKCPDQEAESRAGSYDKQKLSLASSLGNADRSYFRDQHEANRTKDAVDSAHENLILEQGSADC